MRLSARGVTLPWQLVELQEPGPVYFPASAGGFAARGGFSEARKIAPSQTTAHRSDERLASGPILIPVLGWSPPYSRGTLGKPPGILKNMACLSTKRPPFLPIPMPSSGKIWNTPTMRIGLRDWG